MNHIIDARPVAQYAEPSGKCWIFQQGQELPQWLYQTTGVRLTAGVNLLVIEVEGRFEVRPMKLPRKGEAPIVGDPDPFAESHLVEGMGKGVLLQGYHRYSSGDFQETRSDETGSSWGNPSTKEDRVELLRDSLEALGKAGGDDLAEAVQDMPVGVAHYARQLNEEWGS